MSEYTVASLHDSLVIEPTVLKACGVAGTGLLVINVFASRTPLTLVNAASGFRSCKFYQVSRVEDGIRYHRLRLGFFVTYAQAEAALAKIQEDFPAAFISRLYELPGRRPAHDDPAPLADSTQTVRVLSKREFAAPDEPAWYVVQLAQSAQPVNLDAMPRLDVFAAYRLYSVTRRQGTPMHSLRLGFFKDEVSASAVCGYLRTFFRSPLVMRVSAAEQARFNDLQRDKSQPHGSAPGANVVYLYSVREPSTRPAAVATPAQSTAAASPPRKYQQAHAKTAKPTQSETQSAAAAVKRSAQSPKAAVTKSSKTPIKRRRSLAEELREEARQIQRSESGERRAAERSGSWLSRLVGRSK